MYLEYSRTYLSLMSLDVKISRREKLDGKIKTRERSGNDTYSSIIIIIISSSSVIEARIVSFLRAAEPKEKSIPSPIERRR